jgi:hypothetical protein
MTGRNIVGFPGDFGEPLCGLVQRITSRARMQLYYEGETK